MVKRFIIEREIDGVGRFTASQLGEAAKTSNAALKKLKGVQWQHSYVADGRTFCLYLAETEDLIREHARLSGFPANSITEISKVIDPVTQNAADG